MNKASAVRTRIVDTASRLFYKQGYNSTGINQVIDEAAIARASLYHHFPAKTDLLNACLTERDAAWFAALESFLANKKTTREKILGIFDFRITRQEEQQFGGCPFVKVSAELSPGEKRAFEIVGRHKDRLVKYIRNLVTQLNYQAKTPDKTLLPETLYFLMEGATVDVNIHKTKKALSQAKKIAAQLIGPA